MVTNLKLCVSSCFVLLVCSLVNYKFSIFLEKNLSTLALAKVCYFDI